MTEPVWNETVDLDLQWDPLDPIFSEEKYRLYLHQLQSRDAGNIGAQIEIWCLIARSQAEQKNLTAARLSLKEGEKLLLENPGLATGTAKIRWLLESGRLNVLQKNPTHARAFLAEAWQLAMESKQDFFAIDVAQMMADLETPKMQQEWVLRAIKMAEDSSQEKSKRWLGSLYSTLGWKLADHLQFNKSLEFFEKALSNFRKLGSEHDVCLTQWSIGKILRKMNRLDEALDIQQSLLNAKKTPTFPMGRLYQELAECLQTLKRPSEAQPYYEMAFQSLQQDQWIQDNESEELQRLKTMGKVKG